ncbi:DUF4062 domain-containing protein [Zoogloea sp.]|uniref:DUF4062 domain-containing protein n=1 Tax=Zoogloea sp. TaxID=49181 RepID=UPI0026288C33|nr:DUF4062 domain-containing protein [Zoogloea sp.]
MIETRQVYLSSTLNDLQDERAAVRAALQHKCLVIESYSADERTVRESCLADVAKCDLYIGILGLRYGHCPDGDLSITELEFDEAVEGKLPQLIFIKKGSIDQKWIDAVSKESPPERIEAFLKKVNTRAVEFSSAADLKFHVLKAYTDYVERVGDGDAESSTLREQLSTQADPAPDSGTELQRMLADRLNTSWSELAVLPEFCGSVVFSGLPKPLTPRGVFEACCGAPVPEDFLCDLGWMASDQGKIPSTLRLLRENHVYRDTVKLMTLVGGEAFVIRGPHEVTLNKYEPLDGDDPRIVAVLAAACMGFGLKLSPGLPEPVNFLRLPVEEFGHRQGVELAEAEIAATVRRKLHLKAAQLQFSPGTGLAEGGYSKSVVKARLRTLLNELKFRLVIVAPDGSPMRDEDRARTVLQDFNVPTLFKGVPRAAVHDLMAELSSLIAPLLDGTLSTPDQGTAANDA